MSPAIRSNRALSSIEACFDNTFIIEILAFQEIQNYFSVRITCFLKCVPDHIVNSFTKNKKSSYKQQYPKSYYE